MSDINDFVNSFMAFAGISFTVTVAAATAVLRSLASGFDSRANNVKIEIKETGKVGCRTLESWEDNSLRLRIVYRDLFILKLMALLSLIPLILLLWYVIHSETKFIIIPALILSVIFLRVYRDKLDNNLKAVQA